MSYIIWYTQHTTHIIITAGEKEVVVDGEEEDKEELKVIRKSL